MKVLIPSSIQALRRSLKPTSIGNQLCPISCAVTKKRTFGGESMSSKAMPGYSMPAAGPATLSALGQGKGYHLAEKRSTESLRYSVERFHAFASGGYTDMARPVRPPGRRILAASQLNVGE